MTTLDKIRGLFIGAFLGDALGAPHEFRCNAGVKYTGKLQHRPFRTSRFQGTIELEVGQVTDDSEMTLTLLRTLIEDEEYNLDNVTLAYLGWANSGVKMMGKNTRALLKGVKTLRGYRNRLKKVLDLPMEERTQSNGSLMRCSPLALFSDSTIIEKDASITNPNTVSIECNKIYIHCLRQALLGKEKDEIYEEISAMSKKMSRVVKDVFKQINKNIKRDISINKGWCCHGLYCAIYTMLNFDDYGSAMKWIIEQKGSDTDTNACISGALIGAINGYDKLKEDPITEKNIDILINCDVDEGPMPRPEIYTVKDFRKLTRKAYKLFEE